MIVRKKRRRIAAFLVKKRFRSGERGEVTCGDQMPDPLKNTDVRWRQRFENFRKALTQLSSAAALTKQRDLTKLEQQGLIQAFEFTHELARKTLKDFLESRG